MLHPRCLTLHVQRGSNSLLCSPVYRNKRATVVRLPLRAANGEERASSDPGAPHISADVPSTSNQAGWTPMSNGDGVVGQGSSTARPSTGVRPKRTVASKINSLKLELLAVLSSLDRGLAANAREAKEVDKLAQRLEKLGGQVELTWQARLAGLGTEVQGSTSTSSCMEELLGTWRLIYTSGFNTGSLGGRRPGPPAALVPTTLGQVYQRINGDTGKLDNIVELMVSIGLPQLPASLLGMSQPPKESPAVRLTLQHDFEVQGRNTIQIVYEDTSVELVGSSLFSSLPKFGLPSLPDQFKPPKFLRSAKFDVTFLDATMRVTRGDRDELRIYLRDYGMEPIAPPDYED